MNGAIIPVDGAPFVGGTGVNIKGYTSSNKYTTPSNGYITIRGASSGNVTLLSDEGFYKTVTAYFYDFVYIRKGITVWFDTEPQAASFVPDTTG